jgi:hypothetical protein
MVNSKSVNGKSVNYKNPFALPVNFTLLRPLDFSPDSCYITIHSNVIEPFWKTRITYFFGIKDLRLHSRMCLR